MTILRDNGATHRTGIQFALRTRLCILFSKGRKSAPTNSHINACGSNDAPLYIKSCQLCTSENADSSPSICQKFISFKHTFPQKTRTNRWADFSPCLIRLRWWCRAPSKSLPHLSAGRIRRASSVGATLPPRPFVFLTCPRGRW